MIKTVLSSIVITIVNWLNVGGTVVWKAGSAKISPY